LAKDGQKYNAKDERKLRLARALRENLKRRKDLARANNLNDDKRDKPK